MCFHILVWGKRSLINAIHCSNDYTLIIYDNSQYSSIIFHCYILLSLFRTSWLWTLYGSWSHYTTHLWQSLWCLGCWCDAACIIIRKITLLRIWQKTTRIHRQRTCYGGLLNLKTFCFPSFYKRMFIWESVLFFLFPCAQYFWKENLISLKRVLTVKQFTLNECS